METEPRRIETLFHAAREHAPGPAREAFLHGACGEDAELRARIEALLRAHDEATGFLEGPAVRPPGEGPGTRIGPYKLLQEIGEGGMGVVYMAEQERPVHRKVALKVIKLGMDTKQVIARFEAERQALAMMEHPHIARVLDAGTTSSGRPYFVMELVRGVSITEYCDTHKLPTHERLRLFVEVCRAIQHAHQKGVIHRDLKPSNVLVTSHDGTPVPKIIDFGVAKATNRRLTERTLFTEFQQIIGTPEYMSPEQAEMSGLDVDTRSDIYALGVLLYQLLTGTTPVDPVRLRTAGFEEMTRMIREDEPQAPSTRVSRLGAGGQEIAQRRASDVGALSRGLRGDLDWIVMKALEKDRTRRYETASAFAEDVVRHLENRPVEAGRPGTLYRLRKLALRNRKAVAVAVALGAALVLGLAGTTAGFLRARAAAERSRAVGGALEDVLTITGSRDDETSAELDRVVANVRRVFGEDHATYAAVLDTLALRLRDAGDFDPAVELAREALDVWRRVGGERHPSVGLALARLGSLLRMQGQEEEAERDLRAALEVLDGASDAPGLAGHEARLELADLLTNRGEYAEADELLGQALERLRASPSPSRFQILETLEKRSLVRINASSPGARETLEAVYAETHAFYPDGSPLVAISAMGVGNYLFQCGRTAEAEPYLREAVDRFRRLAHPSRAYSLAAHDALFQILRGRRDPESVAEADDLLRETIELARSLWSAETLAQNLSFYANRMLERGRPAEALEGMAEALDAFVAEGKSASEREPVLAGLAEVALRVVLRPDLEPAAYARVRELAEEGLEREGELPGLLVLLAGAQLRLDEPELARETLALAPTPLASSPGRVAARLDPADLGLAALVAARLGDAEAARTGLRRFHRALEAASGKEELRSLVTEIESVLARTRPSASDG